ncbi:hypothetical protein ACKFKF_29175 [Phormidesmis sp. 146-12]
MVTNRNAKYPQVKGASRGDQFLFCGKEEVLLAARKIPKSSEAGIRALSKLTNIGASLISIAEKSLALQQVPRSRLNLASILDKYWLEDRKTVLAFLKEHQDVANFLIEAHKKIGEYFSSNLLKLRVSQDPEDSQLKLLVLSVVAKSGEVEQIYEKFTALEDAVFLNDSFEVSTHLCIKLDFE